MLIGNKADLTAERAVKTEEGVQVAKVSKTTNAYEIYQSRNWVSGSVIEVT